jgi:uncharacterized protein (DUF58 family)
MRAVRAVWFSALGLALVGGMASGLRAYYLVFFSMLFLTLCCAAMSLWTYVSFSYLQRVDRQTAVRGEEIALRIGIYNDKFYPFTRMRVRVKGVDVKLDEVLALELAPHRDRQFEVKLALPYRGVYQVGMTTLWVCDCFGLLPLRFDLRHLPYYRLIEVTVLPALTRLPAAARAPLDAPAAAREGVSDAGDSFAMARPYRPGDPLKRVHWKLSARRGEMLVKQYDVPQERACLIAVDARPMQGAQEASLRYADAVTSCALALADQALLAGHPVRVLYGRGELSAPTPRQFEALRLALARLPFEAGARPPEETLDAVQGPAGLVYVVSGLCGAGLNEPLRRLSPDGCALVHIGPQPPEGFALPCYAVQGASDLAAAMSASL